MVGIDRNRINFDYATRIQRDGVLAENWQKQANDANTLLQGKKPPLQQAGQKQLAGTQATSQTNRMQAIQAINKINGVDAVDEVDEASSVSARVNFQNAGRFDLKQDIADFIRPKALVADYLKKETLSKTSKNILAHLELSGGSEALMKRAEALLQEENNVKSVTDAYRHALIFS